MKSDEPGSLERFTADSYSVERKVPYETYVVLTPLGELP
jgi:hypothetical protein